MYLSRITLHTAQLLPAQLLHLVDRGEYVMHQWLWDLFPAAKKGNFFYRREELQGAFRFLSSRRNARRKVKLSPSNAGHLLRAAYRTIPLFQPAGESHNL